MKLRLIAQTTSPEKMRYPTVGDWEWNSTPGEVIEVAVTTAKTNNCDYDFLLQIHELIEAYLCYREGVTTEVVDKHDMAYEDAQSDEPGDDPNAPYKRQHQIATVVEMLLLAHMQYAVKPYEDRLEEIYQMIKALQNA